MELPPLVTQFIHKKEEKPDLFLSLLFDIDGVIAALWHMEDARAPNVTSTAIKPVDADSWETRIEAAVQAVTALDVEADTVVNKVILGLPASYLSEEGDIKKEIRPHLRKLTHTLELIPLGFVSIHQALVHELKREEGVPPTVILLGVADGKMTVSVYKIGALVGQKAIAITDPIANLEETLHGFAELEVLPSRILMYGMAREHLEELKRDFLRHPWQTRANFMHFPKIDLISNEKLIGAISLVGASELATAMTADEPEEEVVIGQQEAKEEAAEKKEDVLPPEEESNVALVDPSSLGFQRNVDVLGNRVPPTHRKPYAAVEPVPQQRALHLPRSKFSLPAIPFKNFRMPSSRLPAAIGAALLFILFLFILYWYIPRATVTIYEVPKKMTKSSAIAIDPTATVADPTSKILPGKKQEKSVMGDKAIAVTGKKQVGDPARGAVKIYNKTFDVLNLSKGTLFTSGDLQFTLDTAVSVASASAVEFTTNTGSLTASAIGTKSNVAAGTIFSIKGYALSEAAAKNDQVFAGGTSRDVTVVTRADQDALVKSLTQDLVDKAKQDLTGSITGDDLLIDGTIKTSVVNKSFVEELDQEAANLHGKLTITVSGISYSKQDLASLLTGIIGPDIPAGYVFDPKNMTISLRDVVVKKDGKITANADFEGTATPQLDIPAIVKSIAGKTIPTAQNKITSMPGVGSVSIQVKVSPWKRRLPANEKNISVSVAVQE